MRNIFECLPIVSSAQLEKPREILIFLIKRLKVLRNISELYQYFEKLSRKSF